MNNTKRLLVSLSLLALLLSACADTEEAQPANAPAPTATAAPTNTPAPPTATAAPTETPAPEALDVTLTRVENETMGISVLVPEGWQEIAPGVYNRGQSAADVTRLIQQAAPGTSTAQITASLLPSLGITELPEPAATQTSGDLTWDFYVVTVEAPPVGIVQVDLALAESDAAAYIVLLQTLPETYDALHEQVFLPAVEGLQPSTDEAGAVYEDPAGLFSVPIPANWTVTEQDDYVSLTGPEEALRVHIAVIEGEDTRVAVDQAWQLVDPEFSGEETETLDIPPAAARGVEEFILVNYDRDEGEPIIQVEGRRHEGRVYVLIFILDLEAYQQRSAQVQIIDSGFDIAGLEEVDLSGVEPLPLSEELLADLESYILTKMDELNVPGLALAITRDGEIVYSNGFGVRNLDGGEPVTAETLMMIGSSTKPMTTMLMAGLVDEGVFDWDTPVVEILPSFQVTDPDLTGQLTMRNLVCACTGVPRRDFEWLFNADTLTPERVIASVADFEFFTDFGEAFQYSNQMVASGGYIATLAAGGELGSLLDDYVALAQERLFDPLAMDASTFSFETVTTSGNYARPYGRTPLDELVELPLSAEEVLVPLAPAGALWSNVLDVSNFILTNLGAGMAPTGERVVSAENLAVTWEPQIEISADASYGLGWIIEDYKGLQVISHAGNTFGFTSELAFLPAADLGIAILTNQQGAVLNGLVRARLLELLYQQEAETEAILQFALEQSREARLELAAMLLDSLDEEALAPYLGQLENAELGVVTLSLDDGVLVLDAGEFQSELRAFENDEGEINYLTFTPPVAGVPLEFTEDDQGNPIMVFGVGVVEYTFDKSQ